MNAAEVVRRIEAGDLSSEELVRSCLARVEELEGAVQAWAYLDPELPLQTAIELDRRRERGESVGVLQGVPIGVKDIFNTRDMPTQMGSPLWEGFTPGNDARVVEKLRWADGIVMGKTHTAEFGVHHPSPTRNPYDPQRSPGTSSSGSAAAVATGMVPLALGSQTAGSTIRPASYCGIYGFKPSFGLVPRTAVLKTTDRLDHVAFMARSVEDMKLVFDLARVSGRNYPFVRRALDQAEQEPSGLKDWRVRLVRGPQWSEAEPYAREALEEFARRVSSLDRVCVYEKELPDTFSRIHDAHERMYCRMLAYYFQEESSHPDKLSSIFSSMVERGRTVTLEDYQEDADFQAERVVELEQEFHDCDVILTLAAAGEARVGLETRDRPDNCLLWTFCGVPSLSIPLNVGPDGLPLGVQIVGAKHNDYSLLAFAEFLVTEGLATNQGPYPSLPESV